MSDTLMAVLLAVVFIGGPFFLLWLLDRRAKAKGPLFSGLETPTMRILALLLGIVFAGVFLVELTSLETIRPAFAILALALLGYSLGAGRPLRTLQGKRREGNGNASKPTTASSASPPALQEIAAGRGETGLPKKRAPRLLKRLGIVVAVSAVAIFGTWWAITHPDEPLSIVFTIGIMLLLTLAYFFDLFESLKSWIELLRSFFK